MLGPVNIDITACIDDCPGPVTGNSRLHRFRNGDIHFLAGQYDIVQVTLLAGSCKRAAKRAGCSGNENRLHLFTLQEVMLGLKRSDNAGRGNGGLHASCGPYGATIPALLEPDGKMAAPQPGHA